nr:MFS transporter [Pseudomonadota bacterium]
MPSPHQSGVFSHRAFALLWTGRLLTTTGTMAQSVAVGWQVYSVARATYTIEQSSFLVGMVGLAQFLPMFALALLAGETADRYDRRKILLCCVGMQVICAALFTYLAISPNASLTKIFIVAGLFGAARAFSMPAGT